MIASFVIIIIVVLFTYLFCIDPTTKHYPEWIIIIVKEFLTLYSWVLLNPFIELFINILICENKLHKIANDLQCYSGIHILIIIFTIIFIIIMFAILFLAIFFYSETQMVRKDASARMQNNGEIILYIIRIGAAVYTMFVTNVIYLCYYRKLAVGSLLLLIYFSVFS